MGDYIMWTEVLDTSFRFPHIDIYQRLKDGVLTGYKALAQEGYVFYDTTANDMTPEGEPITFYFTIRIFPKTYNMANFSLVAVPRDSVDEDNIFGDVEDNNHEVM